jgi:orotate phosphoribosyltransferase
MSLIAKALLDENAVFLRPEDPFTWTSGIKSPIYCDNRLLISVPQVRELIVKSFLSLIKDKELDPEVIAGTATAGIPWAAWIAHELKLPLIYIRSQAKGHGRQNMIEGKVMSGSKTLLIEDLISTGKSLIHAADVLNAAKMKVIAVCGIFHYNLPQTLTVFKTKDYPVYALATLDEMLRWATENSRLREHQNEEILLWRKNLTTA